VLSTVTTTEPDVVTFPAASRARAVSVCDPPLAPVVFQEIEYGADVSSAPRLAPSSLTCAPAPPRLSDAFALTLSVPATVLPDAGAVIAIVGAMLSTVTATLAEVVTLPAASRATADTVCGPLAADAVFHGTEYGAVVSSAPTLAPSTLNCTPVTPTLSVAVAEMAVVPAIVAPGAGDVTATAGGVVSLKTVTVTGLDE